MNLWIIATVAAYYIKGLCGFANTLVFTSILSFRESNAVISPVDLLLGYTGSTYYRNSKLSSIAYAFCSLRSVYGCEMQ